MTHNFFPKPRIALKLSETSFLGKNNPREESEAENLKNKFFEFLFGRAFLIFGKCYINISF